VSVAALPRRKRATALALAALVAAMVGLTWASAPLYRLFCQVTGFGGTTRVAGTESVAPAAATMTIRFNADVARGLPWRFYPAETEAVVRIGATTLASYTVENPTARPITGVATFNVTPEKAGPYFVKVDCFCFEEQTLAPGAKAALPVSFYVDPAILEDPTMADVRAITLSYTFFEREPE
jgi:cytochrome c oxidase assembly protein subunit 11